MPKKLILASQSPRRAQILGQLIGSFQTLPADVEEKNLKSAHQTVAYNALLKAQHIATRNPDSWVIGSDTVVSLKDQSLGKPQNLPDAHQTLEKLSGRSHEVFTAVSLLNLSKGVNDSWIETSQVTIKELNKQIIEQYFSLVNPLDKAGAYNIEEHGELIIDHFDGEFENIMGLPKKSLLQRFYQYSILSEDSV